ncbi:hypothetical protein BDA96_02G136900 [Sorghum bicolor]|uniref:Uncharacterized protein n=3 Tax=Sorghum bicolor TaxID=4558 RepID=A0A921U898_SORBI|nr:hypothetical protein BDA96_10G152700 [Sorghum bicolor]KAG0514943.1 hypothetical protein BDA96_10G236700 [Sorghum bicolor]KAG0518800.1 hypothetical protein BDA96_09G208100 [Sorghum bicolor]KAG0520083.1 hypothetical protein BDA96_08G042700 [Sorghum bicolor]KAG0521456.1 hypothetical protein BDA96_08G162000 [Sorghum bicolor]
MGPLGTAPRARRTCGGYSVTSKVPLPPSSRLGRMLDPFALMLDL